MTNSADPDQVGFFRPTDRDLHCLQRQDNFGSSRTRVKTNIGIVDLTICLWLGPPWFNYWFSFTLAYSRISHEYSSLFIIVINLIFMFSL